MILKDFQLLAKTVGIYSGDVDNHDGPQTRQTLAELVKNHPEIKDFPLARQMVAACQIILNDLGFSAGNVDGYAGHNTKEAYQEFLDTIRTGTKANISREPVSVKSGKFPRQKDCATFYGNPGPEIANQLVRYKTPYQLRIDWNLDQTVNSMSLHKKCGESAMDALNDALKLYGYERLVQLGLDRFAGSYNHRKMRGGSSWSMHAYGCAIDWYAEPNGLRMKKPQALFSKPEYVPWWEIWESHGWTSLGREADFDYMHVQAAFL